MLPVELLGPELNETTGGEFGVYRGFFKASIRYIDLLNKAPKTVNYPPENVLEESSDSLIRCCLQTTRSTGLRE